MSTRENNSNIFLIIAGIFAFGVLVLILLILLSQRETKELKRDIITETSRVAQWKEYHDRLKKVGKGMGGDDEAHMLNMKVIESEAKAAKIELNLVNIRSMPASTPDDTSKISLEFRNAQIASLVKYLRKLEENQFIVQHLWIYLSRDGKSWDARAMLVQKP